MKSIVSVLDLSVLWLLKLLSPFDWSIGFIFKSGGIMDSLPAGSFLFSLLGFNWLQGCTLVCCFKSFIRFIVITMANSIKVPITKIKDTARYIPRALKSPPDGSD